MEKHYDRCFNSIVPLHNEDCSYTVHVHIGTLTWFAFSNTDLKHHGI